MAEWIDGRALAKQIQEEVAAEVRELAAAGCTPGLAVVLVGEDPASQVYVRGKARTCQALGMTSLKYELPASTGTRELVSLVDELNGRPDVHGILVQVPLPSHVDAPAVLNRILPEKDVDGFHPVNVGHLVAGDAVLRPCTPAGIMEIFRRHDVALRGKRAVVIGRSEIVGKPIALMLMHADATVTICHSRTQDLPGVAREADVLVVAVGRPAYVDDRFVKPGAVVIDVGVNRVDSREKVAEITGGEPGSLSEHDRKGYAILGDVWARKVFPVCGKLTPVPGGVGPLTIAMLMKNTVTAAAALRRRTG
jgi:methylenetetrahydrofolate dehydrogenase (NADP+) / methenyltetrahydrofolate cyclohydrolase